MNLNEARAFCGTDESFRAHFEHVKRIVRFDTVTGPLIGASVILGTLGIAALAAYLGGA